MERPGIHVLQLIDSLGLGGAERMLLDLANCSHANGIATTVCITRQCPGNLEEQLHPEVPVWRLERQRRFDWGAMRRYGLLARAAGVTVVHAHSRHTFAFAASARTLGLLRAPIVLHDHYGHIDVDTAIPAWFKYWGRLQVAYYVGVHEKLGEWAAGAGVPCSRITTIGNAMDLGRFSAVKAANVRSELGIAEGIRLGIAVGNWRKEKGLHVLLHALKSVPSLKDNLILIVGGKPDDRYLAYCKVLTAELGLTDHVCYLGERGDVPSLLRAADYGILPSISESGPLVLLEYMLASLPFVATLTGNISMRVAQSNAPEFVPPDNVLALGAAVGRLLTSSREELESRGHAGWHCAMTYFDIKKTLPAWLSVYEAAQNQRTIAI